MKRIESLRKQFSTSEIDGLLIAGSPNRQYMTQFTGTAGVAIITSHDAVFITDFRYMEQAVKQVKGYEIIQHTGPIHEEVSKQVKRLGIGKLGFEQTLTYEEYDTYSKAIESAKLIPVKNLIEDIRLVKDEQEILITEEAAEIADQAFSHILNVIRPGITEREVANELEFFMRKQGATSSSFDIIVASGHRSALPHGVASEKSIETGDLVTLDFGAYYKGYCSDITRTIAVGQLTDEQKEIYEVVLEAQLRGMRGLKPGITGKEADALTRNYITEKGYGEYFGHSTGHGIGMEIHEAPVLSKTSTIVLKPGMIVTCEPGIYIAGVGGVRIEDDCLITEEGSRTLTHSPKELIYL